MSSRLLSQSMIRSKHAIRCPWKSFCGKGGAWNQPRHNSKHAGMVVILIDLSFGREFR